MVVVEFVLFLHGWRILQDERLLVLNVVKCSVAGAGGLVCRNQKWLLLWLWLLISTLVSISIILPIGIVCCIMVSVAIIMLRISIGCTMVSVVIIMSSCIGLNPATWCSCLLMSMPIIGIMTVPVVSMRVSQRLRHHLMRMRSG